MTLTTSSTMRLRTSAAERLYEQFRVPLRQFLRDVDAEIGVHESPLLFSLRSDIELEEARNTTAPDEWFNDMYALRRYIEFFEHYGEVWRLVADERFSASWSKLQDALDALRLVRRFSQIDTSVLEDQLVELEKTYPYNVFFSMGAIVERFECSLCGEDIDSFRCIHRKGQLYRGRMAVAIARNIVEFDHLAIVDQPEDRRCVVSYDDQGEQFSLVRLLSRLLQDRKYVVSHFGELRFSKRRRPNPNHTKLGRNDLCYCESGLKFKRCCIGKSHIEGDHVDIIPRLVEVERAVA